MALLKTTTFKGITINDAYHRVWGVSVSKDNLSFRVGVHVSADSEMIISSSHFCYYNIDGENPIRQAYEYLKALPEFNGATDV